MAKSLVKFAGKGAKATVDLILHPTPEKFAAIGNSFEKGILLFLTHRH